MNKVVLQSWIEGIKFILSVYEKDLPPYIYRCLGWLYEEMRGELTLLKYKERNK